MISLACYIVGSVALGIYCEKIKKRNPSIGQFAELITYGFMMIGCLIMFQGH